MEPRPRDAKLINCVLISGYGSCFLLFLISWMDNRTPGFVVKVALLLVSCLLSHFFILRRRQDIYMCLCRIYGRRIRFFEFPYFVMISSLYILAFLVAPFLLGLIAMEHGVVSVLREENLTMYFLFACGAALVIAAISGFDIYPMNVFATRSSLQHLISITRDLMKLSNRILVLVAGSLLVGWVFKKIPLSSTLIYLTLYGIVGFALGSTGVLGARVTDLLYMLSELEEKRDSV